MAAICNICFDPLDEAPEAAAETEQGQVQEIQDAAVAGPSTRAAAKLNSCVDRGATAVILAMQCGHVYHQICISEWLTKKVGPNIPKTRGAAPTYCPTCNARVTVKKGLRLFLQHEADPPDALPPILTAETPEDRDADEQSDHEEVPRKKKRTEEEEYDLEQLSKILEDTAKELEAVKAENELLKVQCAVLGSELDATKTELEEARQINLVVQENWDLNVETVRRQQPSINNSTQLVKPLPLPVYPNYASRLPAPLIPPVFGSAAPAAVGNAGNQSTANRVFGGIAADSKYVANSNLTSTANHSSAAQGLGTMNTVKATPARKTSTRKSLPKQAKPRISTATMKNVTATTTVTGKPGPEPAGAGNNQPTAPALVSSGFVGLGLV